MRVRHYSPEESHYGGTDDCGRVVGYPEVIQKLVGGDGQDSGPFLALRLCSRHFETFVLIDFRCIAVFETVSHR
jgi:hypothetical protein